MHVPLTEVILTHDGAELARATFPPGEYVIGREAGVDLFADTPLLSRRHARLTINYDHLLIEDLASSNGTFVNERPVNEPTRLFPNQSVRLGPDLALEIRRQRAPSEPGVSLAPAQAAIARHLPEELLAQRRYAIGGVVAQGGMGAILDARQRAIDRTVAMKVMLESADEASVLRFIDEAKITGQLDHPNIVPIYELGVDEQGQVFYTMKMVRGITLKKVLELLAAGTAATAEKYPLPVLLTVFQKVCDALAFAHSRGVIHRDLKPENLMLGDFGSVLVMDWGLAKVLGNKDAPAADPTRSAVLSARAAEGDASFTMVGSIMGTPAYMSPEQARGEIEILDARSDIYALGAILFEILHLRPAVTGCAAMEIVDKVARGEVEWLGRVGVPPAVVRVPRNTSPTPGVPPGKGAARRRWFVRDAQTGGRDAHPTQRLSASLAAVVRKAMALDAAARYRRVEDLQADVLAYQNGFATSAEKAGAWKQVALFVKRHKAASIGVAAVLLVGSVLGTKAIIEGRRAEREAANAKAALADLKRQAPALHQLAESEAQFQRLDSALAKCDAALAVDPGHLPALWTRSWLLLGLDRFDEAANALRLAEERDALHRGDFGAIRPVVEKLAPLPPTERWKNKDAYSIYDHVSKLGATGSAVAISAKVKLSEKAKQRLIRQRLDEWLGKDKGRVDVKENGEIHIALSGQKITTLEALKGLQFDGLEINATDVRDLEPLRGMHLVYLSANNTKISDLSPLAGMPLRRVEFYGTPVRLLTPLQGTPLEVALFSDSKVEDFSPLHGAPLRDLDILGNQGRKDKSLNFLADSPIEKISARESLVDDVSALRGKPLQQLDIRNNDVRDLSPLVRLPITYLNICGSHKLADLSPLRQLPNLEKLAIDYFGPLLEQLRNHPTLKLISTDDRIYRPVEEVWKEWDARMTSDRMAARIKLESLLATHTTKAADGLLEVDLASQNLSDLAALKGLKISKLSLDNNPLDDLAPLEGMPLAHLNLRSCWALIDLRPLRSQSLKVLNLFKSQVSDLSPLRGMPLEHFYLDGTPVKDLRPLLEMPKLRRVMIPRTAANLEVLRELKNLEYLGWEGDWEGDGDGGHPRLTPAEFWQRYDALKAAGPK